MRKQLLAVRNVREELKNLKEDLRALDDILYFGKGYVLDDMPKAPSGAKNGLVEGLIKREKLEEKYDEKLNWFFGQKAKFEALFLERLNDRERRVMELYYFQGLTWVDIADKMGFSLSWIFKTHKAGIKKIH